MFGGKNKAITFSYDDGVTQDIRLTELFNKYDLKATFNLNSQLLGMEGRLPSPFGEVSHNKVPKEEVAKIYAGHEVAVHTCTHPLLPSLEQDAVIEQVERDRKNLEDLVGYPVVGMAYPGGGINNDDRVAAIIRDQTAVRYARTTTETRCFDLQNNLYRFHPLSIICILMRFSPLGKNSSLRHTANPNSFIYGDTAMNLTTRIPGISLKTSAG